MSGERRGYLRAGRIARLGKPPAKERLIIWREHESEPPEVDALTPSQRATYEMLKNLTREAAKRKLPGGTSDHDDMYDEFGLPR
jgi:hypothetical protein